MFDLAVGVVVGEALGAVVTALVNDLLTPLIAALVVLPINALIARARRDPAPADPTTKKCSECLSEIPIAARRCAYWTSGVVPAAVAS